jgi:long-chain fatty acid transport protein
VEIRSLARATTFLFATLATSAWTTPAGAGGLYFSDRGVRPLGRAGSFVAGADDGGAIYYNPAGLAFAGNALLIDAAWLQYSSTYQREARFYQTDPNTGERTGQYWDYTYPAVEGTTPVLPIPTVVYSDDLGQRDFTFAAGLSAPYAAITSFPETVKGQPAPQRYSLITLNGSALIVPGVYAAWHEPKSKIALGAGLEMLTGYFQSSIYFSACVPERFICAPEQPEYDSFGRVRVGPIFAPSGILGAVLMPSDMLRIGASFHLPFWISAPATEDVRLPSAAAFDQASVRGNEAHVKFRLPWVLRGGVELRPTQALRLEAGGAYEAWSMHDEIEVTSKDLALENVAGFPQTYVLPPLEIERNFRDTYSLRVGGEVIFPTGSYKLGLRAGVSYEKSAVPNEYLSAASIDLDKVTLALGGSLYIGKWRFDGVIARVIGASAHVGRDEQKLTQLNPVLANPSRDPHYINAGTYQASANVLGAGIVYQFDSTAKAPTQPSLEEKEEPATRPAPTRAKRKNPVPEPEDQKDDNEFEKAYEKEIKKPK